MPGSNPSPPAAAEAAVAIATPITLRCTQCGADVPLAHAGEVLACPSCSQRLGKIAQLDQLLARWFEPRRWRADLVRPSVPYLLERLWTANGQGERLYQGVSPHYTNYDIFRNMVTRLIIQGVEDGWADITFPPDPLVEDPQYELRVVDSERFARGVEKLFPEVNWDEPVELPTLQLAGDVNAAPAAAPGGVPRVRRKSKTRPKRR